MFFCLFVLYMFRKRVQYIDFNLTFMHGGCFKKRRINSKKKTEYGSGVSLIKGVQAFHRNFKDYED